MNSLNAAAASAVPDAEDAMLAQLSAGLLVIFQVMPASMLTDTGSRTAVAASFVPVESDATDVQIAMLLFCGVQVKPPLEDVKITPVAPLSPSAATSLRPSTLEATVDHDETEATGVHVAPALAET